MQQRGVTLEEMQRTLLEGWEASDAKAGTRGKVLVFLGGSEWEGHIYQEKEITVYYKSTSQGIVLLTVLARYGQGFQRE